MTQKRAFFRFYEELNGFLAPKRRKVESAYRFRDSPAIKDPIETLGVPHTEVDLILVDGESVGFDYRLADGDRVSVYPVFEAFDIGPLTLLRHAPLRRTAFVADVNLGKLARTCACWALIASTATATGTPRSCNWASRDIGLS